MSKTATSDQLLGSTARWTASVRAQERARADRLFDDPWAAALAGTEGAAWMAQRSADSTAAIVVRTRFFDDFLLRITRQYGVRQIVLLAAGLDTRAFRIAWPAQTRLFELDQAPVLTYKEQILRAAGAQSACARQTIAVDLTGAWAEPLIMARFDPHQAAGWLLEGFLFYLANDRITQILDQVTSLAAPGSWLAFDIINSTTLTSPLTRQWIEMQAQAGAPWIGTLDDPAGFLAARGWKASLTHIGAPEASYGRWPYPVIPSTMPNMPHHWFVTAQKDVDS